jgi:uncharacterized protein (TIGR03067 family)
MTLTTARAVETHPLVGTWRIERLAFPGEDRQSAIGTRVVFQDGVVTFRWKNADEVSKYKYVVDDGASPGEIDLTELGLPYGRGGPVKELGIYRIRGDRLKLCLGGEHQRPEEFAAPGLRGVNTQPSHPVLYLLRRIE